MKVYVVLAHTGEDDSQIVWVVCAYADRSLAEQHALAANAYAEQVLARRLQRHTSALGSDDELSNPWDAEFLLDYTGTHYRVCETVVRDALPMS